MLGLAFKNNHLAAAAIPAGQIVKVIGPATDKGLVVVSVNDEQFHVFTSDLADRGIQVQSVDKARSAP
jgi:hypothetical protein